MDGRPTRCSATRSCLVFAIFAEIEIPRIQRIANDSFIIYFYIHIYIHIFLNVHVHNLYHFRDIKRQNLLEFELNAILSDRDFNPLHSQEHWGHILTRIYIGTNECKSFQDYNSQYYTVIDRVRGQQQGFFYPRTDLLPEAAGWGQQIRSRVKQNCCCPRTQSITLLLYTFIFSKILYSLFPLTYPLDVLYILVRKVRESGRRLYIVTSIPRELLNQWK